MTTRLAANTLESCQAWRVRSEPLATTLLQSKVFAGYLGWRVTPEESVRDKNGRLYAAFEAAFVLDELTSLTVLLDTEETSASSGKLVRRIVARRTVMQGIDGEPRRDGRAQPGATCAPAARSRHQPVPAGLVDDGKST